MRFMWSSQTYLFFLMETFCKASVTPFPLWATSAVWVKNPYLKSWAIFWLNHVLLFLILDVDTQVNKQYFSICNENAPQHTDIVWKGLVLQTRTWKWTAVILFATSCISNSSSKSNNSSNNVITAINNSSDINKLWVTEDGTDIRQK